MVTILAGGRWYAFKTSSKHIGFNELAISLVSPSPIPPYLTPVGEECTS